MAYNHIRVNLTQEERDSVIDLIDYRLKDLSYGDDEFAHLFRIRDRLARCKLYSQNKAS